MRCLPYNPSCFVCGKDNPAGLKIKFFRDDQHVWSACQIPESYSGYQGFVHGGMMSAILDEALGRIVAGLNKVLVVTGDLSVRYHRPLQTDTEIKIEAIMDQQYRTHHHFWTASGKIVDSTGQLCASASGRFFALPVDKQAVILASLRLWDEERPVTLEDI